MSIKCKSCGSERYIRNGYNGGKQRYKCKECSASFREGNLEPVT